MIASQTASMTPYLVTIVVLVAIIVTAVAYSFWPGRHEHEDKD